MNQTANLWFNKNITNLNNCTFHMQTYVTSSDKEFAAATIQAIGRCASNIAEVTDTCLNGLVLLMSNRDGKFLFEKFKKEAKFSLNHYLFKAVYCTHSRYNSHSNNKIWKYLGSFKMFQKWHYIYLKHSILIFKPSKKSYLFPWRNSNIVK